MPKSVEIDLELAKKLHEQGKSLVDISKILGCERTTLTRKLKIELPNLGYNRKPINIGDTFANGTITILEELDPYKSGFGLRKKYKIHCSRCNSTTETTRQNLVKSDRTYCNGCRKSGSKHFCWQGFGEICQSNFHSYEIGAKKRNLEFDIDIEYIWNLFLFQNRKCALTGVDLTFNLDKSWINRNATASLDRIDNTKGYIKGNLQWIHKIVNMMKQDFDQKYFIDISKHISTYQTNKSLYLPNETAIQLRSFHKCWQGYGNIHLYIWNSWKRGAKTRNLDWSITIQQGWNLFVKQGGLCAFSGLPIDFYLKFKEISKKTASLDRIDGSKGYSIDNVQWVHKDINVMKWNLSDKELIEWMSLIAKYN